MTGGLVPVRPWRPEGDTYRHLRHDLANALTPLLMAADLADGPLVPVLTELSRDARRRLLEVSVIADPPAAAAVPLTALLRAEDAWTDVRVLVPLVEWLALVADARDVVNVDVTEGTCVLSLTCPPEWIAAAATSDPAAPYIVKRGGASLCALVALVDGCGGTVAIDPERALVAVALLRSH